MRQIMVLVVLLWGQICFGEGINTGTVTNTGTSTKIVGLSPLCPMVMHMLPLSKSLEMEIYPSILKALILLVEGTKDDNVKPILEGLKQSLQKVEMDLESVEKSEKEYEEAKAETKRQEEICRRGQCEHWKEWRELQEEVEGEGNKMRQILMMLALVLLWGQCFGEQNKMKIDRPLELIKVDDGLLEMKIDTVGTLAVLSTEGELPLSGSETVKWQITSELDILLTDDKGTFTLSSVWHSIRMMRDPIYKQEHCDHCWVATNFYLNHPASTGYTCKHCGKTMIKREQDCSNFDIPSPEE